MHRRRRRRRIGRRILIVIVLVLVLTLLLRIILLVPCRSRISTIISIRRLLHLLLRKRRMRKVKDNGKAEHTQKKNSMTDTIIKQLQRKRQRRGGKGRKTRRRLLGTP